jgi:hypothetical protein
MKRILEDDFGIASQSSASVFPSSLPSAGEVPMKFRVVAAQAIPVKEPSHHKQHASAIVSSSTSFRSVLTHIDQSFRRFAFQAEKQIWKSMNTSTCGDMTFQDSTA